MKTLRRSDCFFAFLAGLALISAGCASTARTKAAAPATDIAQVESAIDLKAIASAGELRTIDSTKVVTTDYEYVQVTGSLIPVRVPKGPNTRPLPGANPVTNMSPEDFERIVQRGLADKH